MRTGGLLPRPHRPFQLVYRTLPVLIAAAVILVASRDGQMGAEDLRTFNSPVPSRFSIPFVRPGSWPLFFFMGLSAPNFHSCLPYHCMIPSLPCADWWGFDESPVTVSSRLVAVLHVQNTSCFPVCADRAGSTLFHSSSVLRCPVHFLPRQLVPRKQHQYFIDQYY